MANCNRNKYRAAKVKNDKINKTEMEVTFNVSKDIDACAKINTKHYADLVGTYAAYRALHVPEDLINVCEGIGCKNTGTLSIKPTTEGSGDATTNVAGARFTSATDAIDYAAGVVYAYVELPATGKYTVTAVISDMKDTHGTNADTYTQEINATGAGFYPVQFDLSVAPGEEVGTGWTPTDSGVNIKLTVSSKNAGNIGLSSIAIYNDIEDLINNEVVILGCVASVDGDDTIDALEEECQDASLDPKSASVDRSVTFKTFTPNAQSLNPLMTKGTQVEGFVMRNVKYTVKADGENGYVHIPDAYIEACGFIYASFEDNCNVTNARLDRIVGPVLSRLTENQFQVINAKVNKEYTDNGMKLMFEKTAIGRDVIIAYPAVIDAEHYVATDREVNEKHTQVTYTKMLSDGIAEVYVYKNVFVTSFPMTLSADDSDLQVSIAVRRDKEGAFYHVYRTNRSELII